jgi:predicted short-subunit dehydrogenase-like oxidoreductase (DUF2520 family)
MEALAPLLQTNMKNIVDYGPMEALTGPVEREDIQTVHRHMEVLEGEEREIYRLLSKQLVKLSKEKHKERSYEKMEDYLK